MPVVASLGKGLITFFPQFKNANHISYSTKAFKAVAVKFSLIILLLLGLSSAVLAIEPLDGPTRSLETISSTSSLKAKPSTELSSFKQTLLLSATLTSKEIDKEDDFDTTGVEPGTPAADETEGNDPSILTRSSDMAEYFNDKMRELSTLETAINPECANSDLNNGFCRYPWRAELAKLKSQFESVWFTGDLAQANQIYAQAKELLLTQLFGQYPKSPELAGRAIWLDRGSIVESGSPEGLRKLLQGLKESGFNVIFFETLNAGFTMYPSQYTQQNPLIKGWNPLQVAVDESHRLGMELHAWVWCFAQGNVRHNAVIGKPAGYIGPVLSQPELNDAALRNAQGGLSIGGQNEFWLSPGKFEARQFLQNLYKEIVSQYNVDGLQLDYIRYPFQKGTGYAGYEAMDRFTRETGIESGKMDASQFQAWNAWKAFQVSSFVRELSINLKRIKPDLTLSAAVFTLPRNRRMLLIQQDWETWLKNGWIDLLTPMSYSKSPSGIAKLSEYISDVSNDRAITYPGVSLIRNNGLRLIGALDQIQENGVMGATLFANAQLRPQTQDALKRGPFAHVDNVILPHRYPKQASLKAVKALQGLVEQMLKQQNPNASALDLNNLKKYVDDITKELETIEQSQKATQMQRLRVQSRVASMDSILLNWKYADVKDELTKVQLKYLEPWMNYTMRLLRYSLNRHALK